MADDADSGLIGSDGLTDAEWRAWHAERSSVRGAHKERTTFQSTQHSTSDLSLKRKLRITKDERKMIDRMNVAAHETPAKVEEIKTWFEENDPEILNKWNAAYKQPVDKCIKVILPILKDYDVDYQWLRNDVNRLIKLREELKEMVIELGDLDDRSCVDGEDGGGEGTLAADPSHKVGI